MYRLVSKYGNAVVETESAVKRDRLIGQGYRLVEEETAPAEPAKDAEDEETADAATTPSVTADAATPPSEREAEGDENDAPTPVTVTEEPAKGKGKSKNGKTAAEDDKKE